MTKKSHNKKRNVGIIYEQLILTVSKGLINDNLTEANTAKKIIKKYFKPGTELYKEHRLMMALITPVISSTSLASNILVEAKNASRFHDSEKLNREKSRLIRDINISFGKEFYSEKVNEYKKFATVQTLINNWRTPRTADFEKVALFESKVHDMLLENKPVPTIDSHREPEVNNLVVDIMTKKFNQRYSGRLSEVQQNIIKQYVFSGKERNFKKTLDSMKESVIAELRKYSIACESNIVKNKINPVITELKELNTSEINDKSLSKFLLLCQLKEELSEKNNG